MKALTLLLLAVALPAWWRESNSHAAATRGAAAYAAKQYDVSAREYGEAQQIAPTSRNAFNSGTALIAAGDRAKGSAQLEPALNDPALRADALFNRGNSALAAKAWDHAVSDYIQALRASPAHHAAKRNLEIALQRQNQARRESSEGRRGPEKGKEQQPSPAPGRQKQQPGQADLEALLRSVQQQEQEELRRLKGEVAEGKVGW